MKLLNTPPVTVNNAIIAIFIPWVAFEFGSPKQVAQAYTTSKVIRIKRIVNRMCFFFIDYIVLNFLKI